MWVDVNGSRKNMSDVTGEMDIDLHLKGKLSLGMGNNIILWEMVNKQTTKKK